MDRYDVEEIVNDVLQDRFEHEEENHPPHRNKKKSILPKFDHLETY